LFECLFNLIILAKKELKERLSKKILSLQEKQVDIRERLLKAEEIIQNYEDKGRKNY